MAYIFPQNDVSHRHAYMPFILLLDIVGQMSLRSDNSNIDVFHIFDPSNGGTVLAGELISVLLPMRNFKIALSTQVPF